MRRHSERFTSAIRSNRSKKHLGLGWSLGMKRISGQILQENTVMLKMCRELGFEVKTDPEDRGLRDVTLTLESG